MTCARALCRECVVATRVGFKCSSCTGGAPAGARRRPRAGAWTLFAALAALAVVAFAFVRWNRDAPVAGVSAADASAAGGVARIDVSFGGAGGVTLGGTLELPVDGNGGGIVVVPGFGPTTRDGIAAPDGSLDDPFYRDIGALLASEGFAVLRYDKRGTGASHQAPDLTIDDYVGDATAAVELLAQRVEVDDERVALVGHDEGGLIGIRVASDEASGVAALALVSTPGRPLAQVLAQEIRAGGLTDDSDAGRALAAELKAAVEELIQTGDLPPVSEPLRALLPANRVEYLRQLYALDPLQQARSVRVPVLIARGTEDPGITDADVGALRDGLRAAPQVHVMQVQGAGHTLRAGGVGTEDEMVHGDAAQPQGPAALLGLVRWLEDVLVAS